MAITHQAKNGEQVTIEPDDLRGPWTIELPDPGGLAENNGWWVDVKAIDFGTTAVTISANGTALVDDPAISSSPISSFDRVFVGDSIRFTYNAGTDHWNIYVTAAPQRHTQGLFGTVGTITGNNQTLSTWEFAAQTAFFDDNPPVGLTGLQTIPVTGSYWVNAWVLGQQSNSNKEFQIVLRLDRSSSGNIDIATFQVATDKTPRYRTFSFPRSLISGVEGETFSLSMRAEGDTFGNITDITASFTIEQGFLTN